MDARKRAMARPRRLCTGRALAGAPTSHDSRGPTRRDGGCRACRSSIGQWCAGEGARGMTAIDFSAFVDELATVSGETILPFFRTALSVEDKGRPGSFDPVTAADHAAEMAMRALIRRTFPDHGIIGEEYGKERADAEYVWVLDPIDGTKSFISGMPAWGTLIALTRFGAPVFGMMNQPFTRERFSGDGGRAHYRGPTGERDLRVRACADLAKAVLFTTNPLLMNTHDRETFGRVEAAVRLSRYGG